MYDDQKWIDEKVEAERLEALEREDIILASVNTWARSQGLKPWAITPNSSLDAVKEIA